GSKIGAAAGTVEDQDAGAAGFERFAALGGGGGGGDNDYIVAAAIEHLRVRRRVQERINDDTQQRKAAREAGAIVEQAVVGEERADAGEDGVGIMAELLNVGAGDFAGDPALVVVGGGDLAV